MSLATDRWNRAIEALEPLRTDLDDRLSIVDGHLLLEKGTGDREWGFTNTPITKDPSAVADYLESLITKTAKELLSNLQASKNDTPAYYEQVALLNRQSKRLYSRISSLQYSFRFSFFETTYAKRYLNLCELADNFSREVNTFKYTLRKPPLSERTTQHIDYNERTWAIKYHYPKKVPLEETVAAAKKALTFAERIQTRPLLTRTFLIIGSMVLLAPSMFLSALKIILWDPFELIIRGTVTTRSPFNLAIKWLGEGLFSPRNPHLKAYQLYCTQLLHCPIITDEVAKAFEQLAPQADVLDLGYAELFSFARDLDELKPFIKEHDLPGALSLAKFIEFIKNSCDEAPDRRIKLGVLANFYLNYKICFEKMSEADVKENFKKVLGNVEKVIKPTCSLPWISPRALERLLNSAASSPTCTKIVLNDSIAELPVIQNFLKQHSYELVKKGDRDKKLFVLEFRRKR